MSRAVRRATRGSARSRRVAVRPPGESRFRVNWVPVVILAGVIAVVGLIAYLLWQQSKPAKSNFSAAAAQEADPAPGLPGTFVDLQKIYGGSYGASDGPNTAGHVTRAVDYALDCSSTDATLCNSNPPAGGPHWGAQPCTDDPDTAQAYCGPTPWGIYRKPWPAASLVHNMEHGGLVLWYNTTNQQVINELEDIVGKELEGRKLMVLTPYPDMEPETIAITAWGRIDKFPVSDYTKDRVQTFIDKLKCRFNPESMKGAGC